MNYKNAYNTQKYECAIGRKVDANGDIVEFRLTYEEWLDIWTKSGFLDKRGNKKECYVMSRYNDVGHYEVGNVFIQPHSDNVRQAQLGRKGYDRNGEKNPFYGKQHGEETIEKCRAARSKQVFSDESKKKMGAIHKGKTQSPEQVAKRVEARRQTILKKKELLNGT